MTNIVDIEMDLDRYQYMGDESVAHFVGRAGGAYPLYREGMLDINLAKLLGFDPKNHSQLPPLVMVAASNEEANEFVLNFIEFPKIDKKPPITRNKEELISNLFAAKNVSYTVITNGFTNENCKHFKHFEASLENYSNLFFADVPWLSETPANYRKSKSAA